jgi:hypothetical protein
VSAVKVQNPIWVLVCDHDGCRVCFEAERDYDRYSDRSTRVAARRAGWSVRPFVGKGSRIAPDLCPEHGSDS